jgi:hypothetical protein
MHLQTQCISDFHNTYGAQLELSLNSEKTLFWDGACLISRWCGVCACRRLSSVTAFGRHVLLKRLVFKTLLQKSRF